MEWWILAENVYNLSYRSSFAKANNFVNTADDQAGMTHQAAEQRNFSIDLFDSGHPICLIERG